ncbi:MAG: zinc-dependent metalloprotease [Bacteroidales bacterium]|nr:zinc-dependent metalloprotease [Bacteroidales bacterium]
MIRIIIHYRLVFGILFLALCVSGVNGQSNQKSIRTLRLAFHVFNDDGGQGNFQSDSSSHQAFLERLPLWINHKMENLDTLKPEVSSGYVKSMNLQIHVDTTIYHNDTYAWDCSDSLDSEYMRRVYVDMDTNMTYRQKHQTLHIFFGGNYPILGGHVSLPGTKRLIAMRGVFSNFQHLGSDRAIFQCGRNLFHEIGHALGLEHNFQGGPSGDQCDICNDNGCPLEGTSNNLMDYWPTYGRAISECQLEIINTHLAGELGDISDVLINDSCYLDSEGGFSTLTDYLLISDTRYLHESLIIEAGGVLEVTACLSVPDNRFIRVMPGGKLVIDGGLITNLCGDLWRGIELIGNSDMGTPAEVRMENDAQIAHAHVGLRILGFSSISVSNAEFHNCIRSIVIENHSQEQLALSGISFVADNKYHHSEEGFGLINFLELEDSRLQIHGCLFTNNDQYRSLSPTNSGTGISSVTSNLNCFGNVFQFLSTGLIVRNTEDSCQSNVSNCQFDFCLVGIHDFQAPFINIEHSSFTINRFSELYSIGVLAEEPGWVNIHDCTFSSDYGGGDLVGYLQIEGRGGTQYLSGNRFDLLGWGIIQLAGDNEPVWPDMLWNHAYSQMNTSGMGLVLNTNQFWLVDKNYTLMEEGGQGLVDIGIELVQRLTRTEEALAWPMGGLAVFNQFNSPALIQTNAEKSAPSYLDHNFFLNRSSNSLELQNLNVDSVSLQEIWTGVDFTVLSPNSNIQEWALAEELLIEKPFLLRSSAFRDEYLKGLDSWPVWALIRIIDISSQSDKFDEPLVYLVRNLADRQFTHIAEKSEVLYPGLRNGIRDSIVDYNQLSLPDNMFIPRLPEASIGGDIGFSIYPNPVQESLFVHPDGLSGLSKSMDVTYEIYSVEGKLIKSGNIQSIMDFVIPVSSIPAGIYSICLRDVKRFYGMRKFIILHP